MKVLELKKNNDVNNKSQRVNIKKRLIARSTVYVRVCPSPWTCQAVCHSQIPLTHVK